MCKAQAKPSGPQLRWWKLRIRYGEDGCRNDITLMVKATSHKRAMADAKSEFLHWVRYRAGEFAYARGAYKLCEVLSCRSAKPREFPDESQGYYQSRKYSRVSDGSNGVASKVMYVADARYDDMVRLCSEVVDGVARDAIEFDEEMKFPNGFFMVIQVCASGTPTTEPAWTQGVLFDGRGNELGCTEVGESFGGEYCITKGSVDYIVTVKKGSERPVDRTVPKHS